MPTKSVKKSMETPLEAVSAGDLARLRELIAAGADVNESDEETPLAKAAEMGRADLVRELLKAGADVNFGGIWVPVCAAVRGKNVEVLKAILEAKPEVDAQEEEGSTALMDAAFMGNVEMVKLLLEAGADPNVEDEDGESAVSAAAKHPEIAKLFGISEKPRPKKAAPKKSDPRAQELIKAAEAGQLNKVRELIEAGVSLGAADQYGRTALYYAAQRRHPKIVEALLDAGADVNHHDKLDGSTPFLTSVGRRNDDFAMMRLLASRGADVNARDVYGRGALELAGRYLEPFDPEEEAEARALRAVLVELGLIDERAVALVTAAGKGDAAAGLKLLSEGVSVNARDEHERTALYMAISRQHPEVVRILLKARANVHQPTGRDPEEDHNSGGMRKPCPKCQTEFISIVRNRVCPKCGHRFDASEVYPMTAGGPPMFITWSNGQLPLMTAVKTGDLELINLLLDGGAEVDKGRENITPLMVACYLGHADAAMLLIKRGANANAQTTTPDRVKEKISPIIIAGKAGNIELVKVLWEAGVPSTNKKATLLVDAARRADVGEIQSVLKEGADPNEQDPLTRDYALEKAAERCDVEAVKILISAGAIVHPPPPRRMPRILCAVHKFATNKPDAEMVSRCIETCRVLIAAGARVSGSYFGFDALSIAKESGSKALIEFLETAASAEKTAKASTGATRTRKKP